MRSIPTCASRLWIKHRGSQLRAPGTWRGKIGRLVCRQRHRVSNARVREVRREEGWTAPPPRKKRHRAGRSTGRHPQKAPYRGHVWSWDFIHDWTVKGGSYRYSEPPPMAGEQCTSPPIVANLRQPLALARHPDVFSIFCGKHGRR